MLSLPFGGINKLGDSNFLNDLFHNELNCWLFRKILLFSNNFGYHTHGDGFPVWRDTQSVY